MEQGDQWPGHPAEPAEVDEVVHPRVTGAEAAQQIGLLRSGEDLVLVPHRGAGGDVERPRHEPRGDVHEPAPGGRRRFADGQRPDLRQRRRRGPRGRRDQGRREVQRVHAGERQRLAFLHRRRGVGERAIGDLQAAHDRRRFAHEPHGDVAHRERSPVAGHPLGIPPALGRQARRPVERVGHRRLPGTLSRSPEFDGEFQTVLGLPGGCESKLLDDQEPVGERPREPHGAVGRRLRVPVDVGQVLSGKFPLLRPPATAVPRLDRQPEGERIVRVAVGIGHRSAADFGPHDLQRPALERRLECRLALAAQHGERHLLTGPPGREDLAERPGVGHRRRIDGRDHVARLQSRPIGRRARSDDADLAPLGRRRAGEVAEIAAAVVLIVKLLVGEFDPFDRRTTAGERDEHPGRRRGIERPEREPGPRRRSRGRRSLHADGRGNGRRFVRRPAGRGIAALGPARRRRRGGVLGLLPQVAPGLRIEPGLQRLCAEKNRQRQGDEREGAAFHGRLRRAKPPV